MANHVSLIGKDVTLLIALHAKRMEYGVSQI